MSDFPISRPWLIRLILGVVLAIVASTVGGRHIHRDYRVHTDIEDFVAACGMGFKLPFMPELQKSLVFNAFFNVERDDLPCSTFSGIRLDGPPLRWYQHRYLHEAQTLFLRVLGPTRTALVVFQTTFYVAFVLITYGLFLLAMPAWIAAMAVAPLIWTPEILEVAALDARDFCKGVFFVGCILTVAIAVRYPLTRSRLVAISILSGIVAGIGIGFKSEVLLFAVFGPATLLLFADYTRVPRLSGRVLAVCGFAVGFVVAGAPILTTLFKPSAAGNLMALNLLGGLEGRFEERLNPGAYYRYGIVFDDGYVSFLANSFGQRVLHLDTYHFFFEKELDRSAGAVVAELVRTFPSDILARWWFVWKEVTGRYPLGILATAGGLVVLIIAAPRRGLFVALVTAMLTALVSLVFVARHYFYTLFIPLFFLGLAASLAWRVARGELSPGSLVQPRRIGLLAMGLVAMAGIWMWADAYQAKRLKTLVATYTQLPTDRLAPEATPVGANRILLRLDELNPRVTQRPSDFKNVQFQTDYLVVRFDCGGHTSDLVTFEYEPPNERLNRTFRLECPGTRTESTALFFPVYQSQTAAQFFRGVSFEKDLLTGFTSAERVRDLHQTPLLLELTLTDARRKAILGS